MIFDKLFKQKDNKAKKDGEDISVQKIVTHTNETKKKTKIYKFNKQLNKKRKIKKISHTFKSYVTPNKKEIKDQVNVYDIIEKPLVTEKIANLSEKRIYGFVVKNKANKFDISNAIEVIYGVRPEKVRIARIPSKTKRIRVPGREKEYTNTKSKKKAYVYLKEGDKIKLA